MGRVRTFVGVEVDAAVRANVAAVQKALARTVDDVNWVPDANLHVTLVFLGEVDDRDLLGVCRAVAGAVKGEPPFSLRVAGLGAFPTPRRPKTVWAGLTDGAADLVRVHGKVERALLDLGAYRREDRAYTPHLTLGRVKSEEAGNQLAPELTKRLAWDGGHFAVDELVVFSSSFAPGARGAPEYAPLGRAPLAGRGGV